jgi:polyisoprenyl-teichoic acid--peptidoglycan teichoic acid transferase
VECSEAQSQIDQGLQPGSSSAASIRLGFHLASCATCRAYRAHQDALLDALLTKPTNDNVSAIPLQMGQQGTARRAIPRRAIATGVILVCVVLPLIVFGSILWRTNANLDAMSVDPGEPGSFITMATAEGLSQTAQPAMATDSSAPTAVPTPWPTLQAAQPSAFAVLPPLAQPTPAPGEALTILLLGSDLRPGETSIPRTDTIIVVRVEPEQGRVALLSLPRDLWVTIPGYGENRLNSAYLWGEHYGQQNGLELARQTVGNALGISIDYVALINFEGFTGLVDNLGGIEINVKQALYDSRFPTAEYGTMAVSFRAGRQHMNGERALIYSRIRHPDSDFERIQRQQEVLIAIAEKVRQRGNLSNLLNADKMSSTLVGYVQTTLPKEQILALAWAFRDMERSAIEMYSLEETAITRGVGNDRYALLADSQKLKTLVARFLAP